MPDPKSEQIVVCAVPGCGLAISLRDGEWVDDNPLFPNLCPSARDLHHRPPSPIRGAEVER